MLQNLVIIVTTVLAALSRFGHAYNTDDLLSAAEIGDEGVLRAIISGGKVDYVMKYSEYPAIHVAARNGRVKAVKMLLEAGVPPDAKNFNNTSPLLEAVLGDNSDVIELLVSKGADIHERILKDEVLYPVLVLGAEAGSINAVKTLLKLGAAIDALTNLKPGIPVKYGGDTALLAAAFEGKIEVIKYLIQKGAKTEVANNQGNTVIHALAFGGHPNELKATLELASFNVSVPNKDGFTPLTLAAHSGCSKCLRVLMKAGATIDTQNGIDFNPLITSVRTFEKDLFKEIMNWSPNVNIHDSVNFTAIYHALSNNHLDMASQLLRRGAALGPINERVKGILDEWTRFVGTCDWFYGLLRSNNLSTKQVSGPEPHLGYCDHIKNLQAHKSIVKLIDQANLYGYDGLIARLNFKSFTENLDGNFEGVKSAKDRAYRDIKHLHKIDYRKKYEAVDNDDNNESLPNILHRFDTRVEPPRPKDEKDLTLSEILASTDTVRQVHRPPPEERPEHARAADSIPKHHREL